MAPLMNPESPMMKSSLSLASLLVFALPLLACSGTETPPARGADQPIVASASELSRERLERYEYTLIEARDRDGDRIAALFPEGHPALGLAFSEGRAQVKNACNLLAASYKIASSVKDDTSSAAIEFGLMIGTKRACMNEAISRLDHEMSARLEGSVPAELQEDGEGARLTLHTAGGDELVYEGSLTAEARFGGPGETVFFEIAPERVSCADGSEGCLRARELEYREGLRVSEGEWSVLEEPIEGFEFREGVQTVIRCARFTSDDGDEFLRLEMVVESRTGG